MSILLALTFAVALNVNTPPASHKNLVGFMDGAGLQFHCGAASSDTTGLRDICTGYLAGSIDQLFALINARPATSTSICAKPDLSLEDVRQSVLTYLELNPGDTKTAGAHAVLNALLASYPCTNSAKP
jgi:hypothetical protein